MRTSVPAPALVIGSPGPGPDADVGPGRDNNGEGLFLRFPFAKICSANASAASPVRANLGDTLGADVGHIPVFGAIDRDLSVAPGDGPPAVAHLRVPGVIA